MRQSTVKRHGWQSLVAMVLALTVVTFGHAEAQQQKPNILVIFGG
jgi:hypothetical protein